MGNAVDSSRRASRAEREGFMVDLVKKDGKIEIDRLYGALTRKWPGLSFRTYSGEYLKAAKARGDIDYDITSKGTFVVVGDPSKDEKQE